MELSFDNKNIVVTGATRGIGKAIADCFFEAGGNVFLTGTNKNEIAELNRNNNNDRRKYFQLDFSDSRSLENFKKHKELPARIDVLVNNAGINIVKPFVDTNEDDYNRIQKINVSGPMKLLQHFGKGMLNNGYGRVVNIASIWSVITRPGRSHYTLSKNALVGLTKTLAVEWASKNVLVNAVSPGFTSTELTLQTNTKEQLLNIEKQIPIQRMAQPEEIAKTVVFLCSDHNTYLTGQNIVVDGGYTNV
jgi:3-oxoacyl-[acyl-carrier protein] reductase